MINTRHAEYDKWFPIWESTRDGIEGQEQVKRKGERYLPKLGGQTEQAYRAYKHRAQYVNFSSRTMIAALGQLFRKDPVTNLIDEYYENIDLAGTSFYHFSRELAREIMTVNRVGVMVDYSDEQVRPYLIDYKAESIINWRTEIVQGAEVLTLVVLEGAYNQVDPKDKFKVIEKNTWKELSLEDGVYFIRTWEKNSDDNFIVTDERIPLKNGVAINYIPFFFFTAEGINERLMKSPLTDFVNVNLGHYINSADYENMIHWAGQKTVVTTGWGDKPFPIGGNANLADGGMAVYLESASDSCIEKAMQKKEEQMAALGSQIISGKGRYVASAETAKISSQGEYASLADIANSLSYCMKTALRVMIEWGTGRDAEIELEYNTDFSIDDIPQGKIQELMGAVQSGMMSFETFFYQLKTYEVYPSQWTIEEEVAAIDQSMEKQAGARESDIMKTMTELMAPKEQPEGTDDVQVVS